MEGLENKSISWMNANKDFFCKYLHTNKGGVWREEGGFNFNFLKYKRYHICFSLENIMKNFFFRICHFAFFSLSLVRNYWLIPYMNDVDRVFERIKNDFLKIPSSEESEF